MKESLLVPFLCAACPPLDGVGNPAAAGHAGADVGIALTPVALDVFGLDLAFVLLIE